MQGDSAGPTEPCNTPLPPTGFPQSPWSSSCQLRQHQMGKATKGRAGLSHSVLSLVMLSMDFPSDPQTLGEGIWWKKASL